MERESDHDRTRLPLTRSHCTGTCSMERPNRRASVSTSTSKAMRSVTEQWKRSLAAGERKALKPHWVSSSETRVTTLTSRLKTRFMTERLMLGRSTEAPLAAREPMARSLRSRAATNCGVWVGSIAMSASAKAIEGSAGQGHAGSHRGALAAVVLEADRLHVRVPGQEVPGQPGGRVGAPVVHDDELGPRRVDRALIDRLGQPGHPGGQAGLFVVGRDDQGQRQRASWVLRRFRRGHWSILVPSGHVRDVAPKGEPYGLAAPMRPSVKSGAYCTVAPVKGAWITVSLP